MRAVNTLIVALAIVAGHVPSAIGQVGDGTLAGYLHAGAVIVEPASLTLKSDAFALAINSEVREQIGVELGSEFGIDPFNATPVSIRVVPAEDTPGIYSFGAITNLGESIKPEDLPKFQRAMNKAIADHLQRVVSDYQQHQFEASQRQAADHVATLEKQWSNVYGDWHIKMQQQLELDAKADESPDALRAQLASYRSQLRESALQSLKLEARRGAIERQLERAAPAAQAQSAHDNIIAELKKAIDRNEAALKMQIAVSDTNRQAMAKQLDAGRDELERLRKRLTAGTISEDEFAAAQARFDQVQRDLQVAEQAAQQSQQLSEQRLAEANLELLRAQQEASQTQPGSELGDLNRQLTQIAIELDEILGSRDALKEMITQLEADFRERLKQQIDFDRVKRDVAAAQQRLIVLEDALSEAKTQLANLRQTEVTVRVWGASEPAEQPEATGGEDAPARAER